MPAPLFLAVRNEDLRDLCGCPILGEAYKDPDDTQGRVCCFETQAAAIPIHACLKYFAICVIPYPFILRRAFSKIRSKDLLPSRDQPYTLLWAPRTFLRLRPSHRLPHPPARSEHDERLPKLPWQWNYQMRRLQRHRLFKLQAHRHKEMRCLRRRRSNSYRPLGSRLLQAQARILDDNNSESNANSWNCTIVQVCARILLYLHVDAKQDASTARN